MVSSKSCDATSTVAMIWPMNIFNARASRESFAQSYIKVMSCFAVGCSYSNKRFTEEHKITYYVMLSVFYCDL